MSKRKVVATHDGIFHSDEIVAIAILALVDGNITILRTRDQDRLTRADYQIDVGQQYDARLGNFDHHHFKEDHYLYGLSSAGLVWREYKSKFTGVSEDMDAFVEAVDARDTRVEYDANNVYEVVFNSITACNDINPKGVEQNLKFEVLVEHIMEIIQALMTNSTEKYTELVQELETTAEVADIAKIPIFASRAEKAKDIGDVVVSDFFPEWREASRVSGKCYIMPGDNAGEYKVMTDTSKNRIIATRDQVYTHTNGFISIVKPSKGSTHIGIAMLDGKMHEVLLADIENVLSRAS